MQSNQTEIAAVMAAAKRQFLEENKKPGEVYSGLMLGTPEDPRDYHLFVMPGDIDGNWDKCMKWAAENGGDLPTRREQRVLGANAKSAFKDARYWSREQRAGNPGYAWGQGFDDGGQYFSHKSFAGRARAVRRVYL